MRRPFRRPYWPIHRQIPFNHSRSRTYAIPLSTLAHRFRGRQNRVLGHAPYQLLGPSEEETLEGWIWHQCHHGCSPTYDILWDMVTMILQSRHAPMPFVGDHWPKNFLNQPPKLKLKRLRTIAQQRHLGITWPIIKQWFVKFTEVIQSYSMLRPNLRCLGYIGLEVCAC